MQLRQHFGNLLTRGDVRWTWFADQMAGMAVVFACLVLAPPDVLIVGALYGDKKVHFVLRSLDVFENGVACSAHQNAMTLPVEQICKGRLLVEAVIYDFKSGSKDGH